MPKVKVGDINIYYEVHGEGEPLVFIPGGGTSVEMVLPRLAVFSKEYRVVAFDHRGIGKSDAPDIPYTMEMFADDLAGLLDVIGIDAAHIVSESYGGMIAQHFAIRHPLMLRSLILVSTYCGGPHSIPPDKEYLDLMNDLALEKKTLAEIQVLLVPYYFSDAYLEKHPGVLTPPKQPTENDDWRQSSFKKHWLALLKHDTYQQLPEIKVPTLIIQGDDDRIIRVENARILASRILNSELVILEKMRHFAVIEAFDECNIIMLDFLRRHRTVKA